MGGPPTWLMYTKNDDDYDFGLLDDDDDDDNNDQERENHQRPVLDGCGVEWKDIYGGGGERERERETEIL